MDITEYDKFLIDGAWHPPATAERIDVTSANTGQLIGSVPAASTRDIDAAVAAARRAFDDPSGWAHWAPADRAAAMLRLADALAARSDRTAELVSDQVGMPINTAKSFEGSVPEKLLRFYASMITQTSSDDLRGETLLTRRPLGVVAAITPWNFPEVLAFFKLAPALAAGCTVVMKPSSDAVLDTGVLADAVIEAGLPAGVLNIVPGGRGIGSYLVTHPGVDQISFTGSTPVGQDIATNAGKLLRRVTLELGGKSAAVILDDADLESNQAAMFGASLLNNGQTCFAGTRILAPASRYDEVVDFYTALARSARIGDSLDPATQIGPVVSARQQEHVESYIAKGISDGARLTTGGKRPLGLDGLEGGHFVAPTIFADVDNSTTIAQEEIFGPVLAIVRYEDDADAIRLANQSVYGLGGTVWSTDHERALGVARQIDTGTIGINGYQIDVNAPYGGVKDSGIGRELGPEALLEYTEPKAIYLSPRMTADNAG
ncbi:aldehyde dehydrogenase [Streptomyces pristinaespiralis]|uniref:aldehyde dehydrogenase n=1 Tax=Streptomyces pristinaespiralis TaxID=38300 RepID=UPI0033C28314